ncbi:3-hydroxybutyrate dehydrogenase [Phyllobacterium ifriqiyense]|uniref:3-hydroxybutyrate dehydrogenase n=1 Tax=Phyllobacterium ifriqiyense TaxID=314238 RepID=A0ABU0S3K6_9HYPH|nr:3-hydroxybutyrate dehydrogenase [Phyllobacterium ifriqiyense]MDQ0995322.1 3-hydroxybutyrate dehydrogenase [Phyllobacterium ifriqiyense]
MSDSAGDTAPKNKVAIVTGSTSGIGMGIARRLAAQGVNIVINGLGDASVIEAERAAIETEFSVRCLYSPANMLSGSEISGMVQLAVEVLGSCDILINNAGIQHVAPIDEFPDEKWDAILQINLVAAFHAIKAVIPPMKARGWGRIINIASAHALVASPYKSAYVAAKHGIAGLTKTAALEVAANRITVNAICPGYVWTPLVEAQIPGTMAARGMTKEQVIHDVLLEAQPTKEFVTIDQVAALAAFLCSPETASITGAIIPIDGGWTAH